MRNIKLILGNITFEDGKAIIHQVHGILECESIEQAEELGELLSNEFEAYIIPKAFKGEILNNCITVLSMY